MNKCVGIPKCEECSNTPTNECADCHAPVCDDCIISKWKTCDKCSRPRRREYYLKMERENYNPSYNWYHTQNNNGNRYISGRWDKIQRTSFKTLDECFANMRAFREVLEDGEEEKFEITYIVTHYVDCTYREDGSMSSGTEVEERVYTPEEIAVSGRYSRNRLFDKELG